MEIKERIARFTKDYDWLDDRICNLFVKYCEIYGKPIGHGIDQWELLDNKIHIAQDISICGCYDTDYHLLPIEYLYHDDPSELIEKDFKEHQEEKRLKEKQKKLDELERSKAQLKRLESKIKELEEKQGEEK